MIALTVILNAGVSMKIGFFKFTVAILAALSIAQAADSPRVINYQGKLFDNSNQVVDDTVNISYRLYDAETAGNLLWQQISSDTRKADLQGNYR